MSRSSFGVVLASLLSSAVASAQIVAPSTPLARTVDSVLTAAQTRGYAGNVLLVDHGTTALAKGYGPAIHTPEVPFAPATVVQIGSNTKDFTAVAILQLAAAGRLTLDDSLGSVWQGVPADKRGITIRMLLKHRAGVAMYGGGDFDVVSRPQMIDRMFATPLRFAPGTQEAYSNVGYSVLAAIIELKSGLSYEQYLARNIFAPLGMRETGLVLPGFAAARLAHGYRRDGTDLGTMLSRPHADDGSYWNLRGNGGLVSTLADMQRFYTALFADRLLERPWRTIMFPDGAGGFAGSDGTNFFFYFREPEPGLDLFLSSTDERVLGNEVARPLARLVGGRPMQAETTGNVAPSAATFPESPVGQTVKRWFELYNAGDATSIRRIVETLMVLADNVTIEQRAGTMISRRGDTGRLTLRSAQAMADGTVVLRVLNEQGDALVYTFELESTSPWRIRRIRLEAD